MSRVRHSRADKSGALVFEVKIDKSEMEEITKTLLALDKRMRKDILRKASRRAVNAHLLPQVRRVTPAGGMSRRGRKPFYSAGMRYTGERFHNLGKSSRSRIIRDEMGQDTGEKEDIARSTGRLRQSLKVKAIRRSPTGVGHLVQSKFKNAGKAYYGAFLELGWKAAYTGRKIPGEWRWKRVADRRGGIAKKAFIRNIWAMTKAHLRSKGWRV